jgi:hypothetical protein
MQDPAFSANSRLGWKRLIVKNTLAYYDTESVTGAKGFMEQAQEHQQQKFFLVEMF